MKEEEQAKVLVVEDDEGLAQLLTRRLEHAGYRVVHATTAAEGLQRMAQGGLDLLILDQRLPGGASGLELYHQVKASGRDVPTILVTAFSGEQVVTEALRAGVRDFVPKTPDYLDVMLPVVDRVLKQARAVRQLAEAEARLIREQAARIEAERSAARVRASEEALREADRRKDEFLAMLAHELRNPLAPIRNALHLLKMAGRDETIACQARQMIERQVEQLVRLIDDLLDVSRITRGKIHVEKQPLDLATVVARAVESSQPLISAREHDLHVSLPEAHLVVEGDPVRLTQVVLNLLNNAAKYTPKGGQIWLTAGREDDQAVVRVRDTGIGIPPEMLPKVFDPFTQVDRTLDRAEGGLGIGLTLVRRLIEMHGGTVQAFSKGPGQGSEFVIRLPLFAETPPGSGDAAGIDQQASEAAPSARVSTDCDLI
jgi:signal transduction histidine kinase